jgi:hypothetical protein
MARPAAAVLPDERDGPSRLAPDRDRDRDPDPDRDPDRDRDLDPDRDPDPRPDCARRRPSLTRLGAAATPGPCAL